VGAPSTVTINGSRAAIKEAYVVLQVPHLPHSPRWPPCLVLAS